jgi:hypothetical protein
VSRAINEVKIELTDNCHRILIALIIEDQDPSIGVIHEIHPISPEVLGIFHDQVPPALLRLE